MTFDGYRPGEPTSLREHEGETWPVPVDRLDAVPGDHEYRPVATLRRIGWLDQKGQVWTKIPPQDAFDGGSLTPLLIDPRES